MDLFDLRGKTALIVGGGSGIGAEFAKVLLHAGVKIILSSRRKELLEEVIQQLGSGKAVSMDVCNKTCVRQAFELLEKEGEKIDICINAAGIAPETPIFSEDPEELFEQCVNVNLLGTWNLTKAVANHMKTHHIQGSIINVASVNGINKLRYRIGAYAASKAAIVQLTKALVGELSPYRIRINCLAPGLVHTPLSHFLLDTVEKAKSVASTIPLDFVGEPHDLASVILLLASNEASGYMTGAYITVDGGVSWGG